MTRKLWETIDDSYLKSLPNPASGYEQYIDIPEFTFLGVHNQPDFGHIKIWFHGQEEEINISFLCFLTKSIFSSKLDFQIFLPSITPKDIILLVTLSK